MFDQPTTISGVLRSTSRTRPNKIAVVDELGEMTYAELDRAVDRLCGYFLEIGLEPGDPVAYLLLNQRELLITYHAATRLGLVVVALNHRLTAAEIRWQLEESSARVIVFDARLADLEREALLGVRRRIHELVVGPATDSAPSFDQVCANVDLDRLDLPAPPDADAISGIWFTSGTTGKPKGAVVRHRSSVAAATAMVLSCGFDEDTRMLAVAPMFHRSAVENLALATTMVGGTHYLNAVFQPRRVLELLEAHRITTAFIVPTMAWLLLEEPGAAEFDLSSLEHWISASAPLTPALEARVTETFNLPCGITNMYGITEIVVLTRRPGALAAARPSSVGAPVPLVELAVSDGDVLVENGSVGEIVASAPSTFSHYLNNPAATSAVRLELGGAWWYRTGDIGRVDGDGFVYLLDRAKDMIVSGGENVYCAEVEDALASHPSVAEVAVVGAPDEKWGEIVVAAVVPVPGAVLTLESLLQESSASLAKYKHPKRLVIFDELPKNSIGKVRKDVIRASLVDNPPVPAMSALPSSTPDVIAHPKQPQDGSFAAG